MSPRHLGLPDARAFALLLFFLALSGCSSWRPITKPPEAALAEPDASKRVLVRLRDGTSLKLESPRVHADSLFGRRVSERTDPSVRLSRLPEGQIVAIPLADIRSVEGRRIHVLNTLLFVAGVGAAGVLLLYASIDLY